MKPCRIIQIGIIGIMSILFVSNIWASDPGRILVLESTVQHPEAHGTAYIDGKHVSIQARGLRPNAVYTVWYVNMKPKKKAVGAGETPYMFRTDKWGNGNYSGPIGETPFGKWAVVMVVLHPNGDPGDMQNMVGALKASLS